MAQCSLLDVVNRFNLHVVFASATSLSRNVTSVEVDRPGLEMTGYFEFHRKTRLVLIGRKEMSYLERMSYEQAYEVFLKICSLETPGIVICHGLDCPGVIIAAAMKNNCSVFTTKTDTSEFQADVLNYLSEKLAPLTSIHANLLEIFGEGVLMIGDSGIGKSEVCLDLIKRGQTLVADDKVEIRNVRGLLEGQAPEIIYGVMECRGIGIVDVVHTFGINSLKRKVRIKYCIDLVKFDPKVNFDRLGSDEKTSYLGVEIPYVKLPVSPGRSVAEVVEVAVTNLKLKEYGFDSRKEFEKRLDDFRKGKIVK